MRLKYMCQECGYQTVAASPGEKDRGFFNEMKSMVCVDCKEVVQVLIGKAKEMGAEIIETIPPECPTCKGNNLSEWQGTCPCCESQLTVEGKSVLWD